MAKRLLWFPFDVFFFSFNLFVSNFRFKGFADGQMSIYCIENGQVCFFPFSLLFSHLLSDTIIISGLIHINETFLL